MKIIKAKTLKWWFVGNFEPNLIKNDELEVGIKHIDAGTQPDYHFHKRKKEYTILIKGKIICTDSGLEVKEGDIICLDPFEKNDQLFLEDSIILVINTPSAQNDKYFE